jgi:hypothetical protein
VLVIAVRANQVQCHRCEEIVVPKIVRRTASAGGVGVPVAGNLVFRSFGKERFSLECPKCGVPFKDDATVQKLNGEDPADVGIFGRFAVMVVVLVAATFLIVLGYAVFSR